VVVIGAGVGGLSAALELRRRGFDVTVLERHSEVGGKASQRVEAGFRWDEGPSILVMPWVYRTLFEASQLDPDSYLPLRRLDPAFRVVLSNGRQIVIPASVEGLRDAFAAIEPEDALGLDHFLARVDRFASLIGHAYCDRIIETWPQVLLSPLMLSAAVVSPYQSYSAEIDRSFRSQAVRELLYGFPTYSGFSPKNAPASMVVIPWTIIREGVWYPARGGIAEIPRAIARGCRDRGVEIRTGVEVEAIERDATGRITAVATSSGSMPTHLVVSNSDYVHTHRLLRGGPELPTSLRALRQGQAEPSFTYYTVQLGCRRSWDILDHHLLVMTEGAERSYDEIFRQGIYPTDPPIYVNTTSQTESDDAIPGGSNPFIVIGAPAIRTGIPRDEAFVTRYADTLIDKLEAIGLVGLREAITIRHITTPHDWESKFHAFRGSIYGLGVTHNILSGAFRPLNYSTEVPGLYFAGGGVQPGAGLPMVVQSGKITAERVARDTRRIVSRSRPVAAHQP
jgi:phytoene desaturase